MSIKYKSDMYKPLIIQHDYHILHSASGQIARTYWEGKDPSIYSPTIICEHRGDHFESRWPVYEIEDKGWIRHIGGLARELGFPDLCHIPDQRRFSWKPFVLKKVNELLKTEQFNYIRSISCPETSHLIALEIKKKTGLPWVAQFNDPWVENEAKVFKTNICRKIDADMERQVAENADVIIHSNHIMVENWIMRYGSEIARKMYIVPFSFNIPNLPTIGSHIRKDDKLIISHIGHLYGKRSALTLFDALCRLRERNKQAFDKVYVNFIGGLADKEIQYAEEKSLGSKVHFLGRIDPDKLEKYYQKSDIFLAIDMNVNRSPSYPSKLLLYHYYQKPIISITTPNSIIENDMQHSKHRFVYYGESDKLAEYLGNAVANYDSLMNFNREYWRDFTVENVTRINREILSNIL